MLHQATFNTSELCFRLGVKHAVLSPGSRNAPLTISFARNDKIKKWIIPDERTAGFIALGVAQETRDPVVLCCTSGTAMLNYAPAIAEAFYREIPLIVLSADRPIELIDQRDGQTIRQFGALKNHVKNSFQLPPVNDSSSNEYFNKIIEGIRFANELPKGPVHFNIPFPEPFYPEEGQKFEFIEFNLKGEKNAQPDNLQWPDISGFKRILILVGQQGMDLVLSKSLERLSKKIPIIISPLNNLQVDGIRHSDLFINDQPELAPDLLITSGMSVLSKKFKNYLRTFKPNAHWHFDPSGVKVDTYGTRPLMFKSSIETLIPVLSETELDTSFLESWMALDSNAEQALVRRIDNSEFSELSIMSQVLNSIPPKSNVHFGNSMPVRYADILGVKNGLESFCNRGTSGIEGVTSTALGASLASSKLNTLITGDLSFLYDRNAFFHNHDYANLRIIVSNNQGGGIFRLIDGPSGLEELEEYFETRHNRTAEHICTENSIEYLPVKNVEDLEIALVDFYEKSKRAKLIEVFSDPKTNQSIYKKLRNSFNKKSPDTSGDSERV